MTEAAGPSVVRFRPRDDAVRVFCFPQAGAGASRFRSWVDHVPEGVEICGIRLPGRENRSAEPPLVAMDAATEVVARDLAPLLDGPYAFFGECGGALVAFELTRRLRREGASLPRHLFVAAQGAPRIRRAAEDDVSVHELPTPALVDYLRDAGGTADQILQNRRLLRYLERAVRADFEMLSAYVYSEEPPLAVPISVWAGAQDASFPLPELVAWSDETDADFVFRRFAGGHFFLHEQLPAVTAALLKELV